MKTVKLTQIIQWEKGSVHCEYAHGSDYFECNPPFPCPERMPSPTGEVCRAGQGTLSFPGGASAGGWVIESKWSEQIHE